MKKKGVLIICAVCLMIAVGYLTKKGIYDMKISDGKPSVNKLVEAKESSGKLLTGELKLKDFEIMGLNLENTLEDIEQILGEPERIVDTITYRRSTNRKKYKRYIYPNIEFEIYLPLKGIVEISVPRPGYKTNRGIQVGDSREQIIKAYGDKFNESQKAIVYHYYEERKDFEFDLEYCLHFVLKNNIITEIQLYEAWD